MRPISHNGGNDYIQNKIWLVGNGNGWIEAGYSTESGWYGDHANYYWMERRPNSGLSVFHVVNEVQSVEWNTLVDLKIQKVGTTQFKIDIQSTSYIYPTYYSNNNTMTAGVIDIGTQLNGTQGASMYAAANWNNNQWQESNGTWHYQTSDGLTTNSNGPITRQWVVLPSQSGTGGDWKTSCGC